MKIVAISDVHVKKPHDEADKLLLSFLNHSEVQSSDYIVFLGDIFDLMCGPHEEYAESYSHLFNLIEELHSKNKKIFFFEGNHDLHLERLFEKVWAKKVMTISQKPIIEEIDGKKYYFSHGDEHEVDNLSYHRYMKIVRSNPLKFVANHLMPYKVLKFIGERASKMSRKRGSRSFDADLVRETFRQGVKQTTEGKFDFVLGGHSHVQDQYKIPGSEGTYLNNGYALHTRTFILIENHLTRFEPLP